MPIEPVQSGLLDGLHPESASALAAALAPQAAAGHHDELRGKAPDDAAQGASKPSAGNEVLTQAWSDFFETLGLEGFADLDHRSNQLARQVRENGVTYNVYADANGPQRPWSLDLFPLILTPQSWQQIEAGILQRVRVLDAVMADVYGPQTLLERALLPAALVQGHPGYLRALHGVAPVGGTHLHIAAFDLARGEDGNWWVVSQRTQAPSGLGYLLENRIAVSRLFPQAFADMQVQRLAATYRSLVEGIKARSPAGSGAHIALLTPGPYNETYFEHAYLARYLGLSLVEGSDLLVRDQLLYLKTLQGLEPVHALLKRLDDEFLDPLELRADSTLGVPGLLQAIRAGNVLVANMPGSGFLESTALLGFLPALARELIGEELLLPALPTWWCGERAAMEEVLPLLGSSVIKPTYPGPSHLGGFESVLGGNLSLAQQDEWAGRIMRRGEDHTVQAYQPLSQMPVWRPGGDEAPLSAGSPSPGREPGQMGMRSVLLRVFAVAGNEPGQWSVLPGGLARLAGADDEIASMQRGGSSADVWVMVNSARGETVDRTTLLPTPGMGTNASAVHRNRIVTSRAAENLFWLGRYTERCENTVRLARLTLERLNGEDQSSRPLLAWLGQMATANTLVLPTVPPPTLARRVFERSLIASLTATDQACSVGYNLRALQGAASSVRERLSTEQWNEIQRAHTGFFAGSAAWAAIHEAGYSSLDAVGALEGVAMHLGVITGAQTDRMTRDDGWRLLSVGRHIERLGFLAQALTLGFESGAAQDEAGFEALLALFDSTITFHGQYQSRHDIAALLDLLVCSGDNPRSVGWVAQSLRNRLAKLAGDLADQPSPLAASVPLPSKASLDALLKQDAQGQFAALLDLLGLCRSAAWRVSEEISAQYFTHSSDAKTSVGA